MLTLQKQGEKAGIDVDTAGKPLDSLLEKEWLLTNTRGGYASSTVVGCNTRRYHGLLVGALDPPVNRVMSLASMMETIYWGPGVFNLATFEFPDKITPDGYLRLKRFSHSPPPTTTFEGKQAGVHFHYELGELRITKSVYLQRQEDTVAIVYEFGGVRQTFDFTVRPFVTLRDYHSLQKAVLPVVFEPTEDGIMVRHIAEDAGRLILNCSAATFEKDLQLWYNFVYRSDRERGQEYSEDLYNPGIFNCRIESPMRLVFWANLSRDKEDRFLVPDIEDVIGQLEEHHKTVIAPSGQDKTLGKLFLAGDQFVVKRHTQSARHTTILAGFPWFADWGRDAFVSLPGLLLATRRFEEAKSVLLTFAGAAKGGMIPNCFDDYGGGAHFNSVDASLWFINAAFAYLEASGERGTFQEQMLPVIISIIESYRRGAQFGIHADKDGLITAGDANTQLTWMDAKYNGIAFTPRYGKAVEVNALWFNALMLLNKFYDDDDRPHKELKHEIDKVRKSFCGLFWNEQWGWLNDCILPNGFADATLRPNQIFAVSLPYSPLSVAQQKAVVNIVEEKLLTPYGLRTLSPDDRRYHGQYCGPQGQRDEAYHQGTVWPYLIGPFVEAYLKVNGSSVKSKKAAIRFVEPLLTHLGEDGCLGQVSEIFDGDVPHKPRGCFAQAWSVAELIRAYLLVNENPG
jgi:predicted glycogen debranching enzyme